MRHCRAPGHLWGEAGRWGRTWHWQWEWAKQPFWKAHLPDRGLQEAISHCTTQKHLNGSWPWTPQKYSTESGDSLGSRKETDRRQSYPLRSKTGDCRAPPGRRQGEESLSKVSRLSWLTEEWPRKLCRPSQWMEASYTLRRSLSFGDPASQVSREPSRVGRLWRVGSLCIPNSNKLWGTQSHCRICRAQSKSQLQEIPNESLTGHQNRGPK